LRLAVTVGPGIQAWSPGRKGGRSRQDASAWGLDPMWNCSERAGRVQTMALSFGVVVYKIPYCVQVAGRVRPAVGLVCRWMVGRKVGPRVARFCGCLSLTGRAESFGCLPPRSAIRTCPEATQWKVLVTFLSIWLCLTLCQASPSGWADDSLAGWVGSLESAARWEPGVRSCPGQ